MKNVLVVGYYGAYNLGDEMMRQVILKGLSIYNDVHVVVMLAETPECEAICGSADVIHYCRTNSDYSHLASMFDALIIGGGALIDENQYGKTWMHFKSLTSIVVDLPGCFQTCGKPVYCLGISTNEVLQSDNFKRRMCAMVDATSYFSVRDKYSYETLREAGADVGKMTCVDDLVLCDDLWERREALPTAKRSETLRVGVVWVSVIPEVRQQLGEFLAELVNRTGGNVRITLIPFFDYQKHDENLYREVLDALPDECHGCVSRVEYVNTLTGVVKYFAEQDVVVNLRYHAALVAGAVGINQLVVKIDHPHYENKMRWIIDEFGDHAELTRLPKSSGELADACIRVSHLARGNGFSIERAKSNRRALEQTLESLHKELWNA